MKIRSYRYLVAGVILVFFGMSAYQEYYQVKACWATIILVGCGVGVLSGILDAIRGHKLTEEANKSSTEL